METCENPKLLENNIDFFYCNIRTLLNIRPDIIYSNFKESGISLSYSSSNSANRDPVELANDRQILMTLNSSIIINCFSLFEASFEWKLLHDLNTKGLTGIQEKVMLKYIDEVIKISSIDKYISEYKFLTGLDLKNVFDDDEKKCFSNFKAFYVIRHLLVHGSSTRHIMIPQDNGGLIRIDDDDKDYQYLVNVLKENLNLNIPNRFFNLDLLLSINQIADLLIYSTVIITKKLSLGNKAKFIKEDIFKK
jgi:hypothetical protein